MSPGAEDRLNLLLNQSALTGIDFIYVNATQDRLDVYFLRPPETLDTPLPDSLTAGDVRIVDIREENALPVLIIGLSWVVVDGRTVMRLDVIRPASFADHRLTINDARIDPYYNARVFSFQADCVTGLDCLPDALPPFPETYVDFPIDYTARDFQSFRRVLLDYAAQRYPHWIDRLEADVGIMLVEVMSALADEMAYSQDRIQREAYLETASQRFSLRQLARLVDYEPFDGQAASTWLDVTCNPGESGTIEAGTVVTDADGIRLFENGIDLAELDQLHAVEIGTGIFDDSGGYPVDAARNRFLPYLWDEDDITLPAGAVTLDVAGHVAAALPPVSGGRVILLQTNPVDASDPAIRLLVRLLDAQEETDPLTALPYTRLTWDTPTPYLLDKRALDVRGNIVPATAGLTCSLLFSVGEVESPVMPDRRAIVRRGANGSPTYRVSLPGTERTDLAYLYDVERGGMRAEIRLYRAEDQITMVGDLETHSWVQVEADEWEWRSSLLGVASSTQFDTHFTLDDGTWDRAVGYPVPGGEYVHNDYRLAAGKTIRFGDGEFGLIPPEGVAFLAYYRLDTSANLPRHVLLAMPSPPSFIESITNPVIANGALPPETAASIRQNAPEAFRSVVHRAVKPDDYAEAVERLSWVQNAGANMRWTGSWRTIFVAADPVGAVTTTDAQEFEMRSQINRFRQAGQHAQRRDPRYADLDVEVTICVQPASVSGIVREAVIDALVGDGGYFSPDNFTFGTRLYRGSLEAAVGVVPGVLAVESIRFRRRGYFDWREFSAEETFYDVGIDTIIRVEHDKLYPERGTLRVIVRGGV